jgi:hypothetical protein
MTMDSEQLRMKLRSATAGLFQCRLLSSHSLGETEETHEIPLSEYPLTRQTSKTGTSQIN